jgi:hypothetical protein
MGKNLRRNEMLLYLDQYRKSPQSFAGASRPKRVYTTPKGDIYFKFELTSNEICAELFANFIGNQLGLKMAETRLAISAGTLGIASLDIGVYTEPDDSGGNYSVKDFIHINDFIEMCLFDYLIMNEDRHAGNWGFTGGELAPLFDHNYSFGGPTPIIDLYNFMHNVTSPFYVTDFNKQRHNTLLKYFVKYHPKKVNEFMIKTGQLTPVDNPLWRQYFPEECTKMNMILSTRIDYMVRKADEYAKREIADNEF